MSNKLFCFLLSFLTGISLCHAEILEQLSKSKDDSPVIIDAENSIVCDETAQKCVATGSAKAQKGTNTVYGDVLTVYFTEGKDREITSLTADGHVRMESPTETAYGEHAIYDVVLDRVLMTGGNLKIVTPKETLTARDSIEYWHSEHKGIARGNAIATFPEKKEVIQADTLIAHFKPSKEKTEDGKEKSALERVEAKGNTLVSGPKGIVTGKRGNYSAKTDIVEVFENVKVTQGGNVIQGEHGIYNLRTDIAEIYPNLPGAPQTGPKNRISGIIYSKDVKRMKEDSKSGEESSDVHEGGQVFPTSANKNYAPSS
ncbi:MAG TPA: LptA/OstA family protein [Alphaproteobacteria bacterium]|nr:LptA/OstA family protein [Alphaproteobacteria bacterium]